MNEKEAGFGPLKNFKRMSKFQVSVDNTFDVPCEHFKLYAVVLYNEALKYELEDARGNIFWLKNAHELDSEYIWDFNWKGSLN